MKHKFNYICYIACTISILIIVAEFCDTMRFYLSLTRGRSDFFTTYRIQALIDREPAFMESQRIATDHKIAKLQREFFAWIILTLTLCTFTVTKLSNYAGELVKYKMNILGTRSLNCNRDEINYICIFVTVCLFAAYGNSFTKAMGKSFDTPVAEIIFYVALFTIALPFLMALFYNLFKIFGSKLIITFYLTFYIKATAEFFTQEEADRAHFKRVDISVYSQKVQEYLRERNLENKVFQEREKSDSINAALVGWGYYEHIEIYGDHKEFSNAEFESVLMHEIGHSQDYSLHKKVFALYVIKALEFALVWWMWKSAAEYYTSDMLTRIGAFIIMVVVYEMYLNRYLMVLHKLTSQNAEMNADLIAKKHGFAISLAVVLFKITVKSNEPVQYTFWYNALKSFHPTILRRVEYLSK